METLSGFGGYVPCPRSRLLAVENESDLLLYHQTCRSWQCKVCILSLANRWKYHLADILKSQTVPLFKFEVAHDRWPSVKRAITKPRNGKDGGLFVRVLDLAVSTAPVKFNDKNSISGSEAEGWVRFAIDDIECPGRVKMFKPISTSHAWALPKKKKNEAKLVGSMAPKSPADIRSALSEHGMQYMIKSSGDLPWLVSSSLPKDESVVQNMLLSLARR